MVLNPFHMFPKTRSFTGSVLPDNLPDNLPVIFQGQGVGKEL
jgi:hypothetical protein